MTWSLRVVGGDFVKGKGNALSTITGPDKVKQDLRHWILSELKHDPFTPNYGSVLEYEPGSFVVSDTGETIYVPENKIDLVVNEIDRIIERYQVRQLSRMEQESILYNGRHTFGPGEIITDYEIEYEQVTDTLYIDIKLTLLSNEERAIELTLKNRTID